jgi:signal transduction histidine kinase
MTALEDNSLDITGSLIPMDDLFSILLQIFPDSIILNMDYEVIAIGKLVALDLGYLESELKKKNVRIFAEELNTTIAHRLVNGYFNEQRFHLCTKQGGRLLVGLSGFYSGLFSDINGYIVLRFRNLEEAKSMYGRLEAKGDELDRFIYEAAHSLRGPLATIKGLIRIFKSAKSEEEVLFIISQISSFAEVLDERLHKLTFLAEADKELSFPPSQIDFNFLESELRETIKQSSPDTVVNFTFSYEAPHSHLADSSYLFSLLINLLSFLVPHPKESENDLKLELFVDTSATEILIRLHGFSFSEETRKLLADEMHSYAELLKQPDMIYCYAAHKILIKMQGGISFNFISNEDQVVIIYFPNRL